MDVSCKDTNLSMMGLQLRSELGKGELGILPSIQAAEQTWDWLGITIGLAKGSKWLLRSGVMWACDC